MDMFWFMMKFNLGLSTLMFALGILHAYLGDLSRSIFYGGLAGMLFIGYQVLKNKR